MFREVDNQIHITSYGCYVSFVARQNTRFSTAHVYFFVSVFSFLLIFFVVRKEETIYFLFADFFKIFLKIRVYLIAKIFFTDRLSLR